MPELKSYFVELYRDAPELHEVVLASAVMARIAELEAAWQQQAVAQTELNETRSEALAGYAVRDAEIERVTANCNALDDQNDQLRAELAAIKARGVLVGRAELSLVRNALDLDAEHGRPVRGEMLTDLDASIERLDKLWAAPVAKQVVMPEREWLQSGGLIYSLENDVNYYEINVTQVEGSRHDGQRAELAGKLIELLNAADQEGGQDE